MKVKKKYFKDNQSYFKFLNKHNENINVIKVKPIIKKDSRSQVVLSYTKKGIAAL